MSLVRKKTTINGKPVEVIYSPELDKIREKIYDSMGQKEPMNEPQCCQMIKHKGYHAVGCPSTKPKVSCLSELVEKTKEYEKFVNSEENKKIRENSPTGYGFGFRFFDFIEWLKEQEE